MFGMTSQLNFSNFRVISRLLSLAAGSSLLPVMANASSSGIGTVLTAKANEKLNFLPQEEQITIVGLRQPRRIDLMGTSGDYVTNHRLRLNQVNDTNNLGRVLPGLQILNSGNFLFPAITVRGVTSSQDFYHPATTFYVDDIPVMPINAMQTLLDINSVQFLRGPQATLYGQSAEGGVIDIATHQPGPNPHASFDAGPESRYGYHVTANVSRMLAKDLLFGSIALTSQSHPGNIFNPATGSYRLGGYESRGGRGTLRLAPNNKPWEIYLSIDGSCTYGSQDVYVNFHDIHTRRIGSTGPGTPNPRLKRCGHNEALRGIYHLNGWKLSAITSWQKSDFKRRFPYFSFIVAHPEQWSTNTQELRLGTDTNHKFFDLLTGFYHQTVYHNRDTQTFVYKPHYTAYPFGHAHNRAETVALYGNAYWHITNTLDLGTGGRLSRDMSRTVFGSWYDGQTMYTGNNTRDQNITLGNISLDYKATSHWHLHSRISQGYKPAGFNFAPAGIADTTPYNSERELSYEIGSVYNNNNLVVKAGYFYNKIRNGQVYVGTIGSRTIANAARSHASGFEGELRWNFLPEWTLSADVNKIVSKFNSFDDGAGNNYAGKQVPGVPQFAAAGHLYAHIETPLGRFEPGLDLRVTGSQYFDLANKLKQPTYAQFDVKTLWSFDQKYEVTLYANNLTNKIYRTYAFGGPTGNLAQINFGRTLGFNVRVATGSY